MNEDVFAYSNRAGEERALVLYHNKFAEARGWIRNSAAYLDKSSASRSLVQKSLGEGLNLHAQEDYFSILRDQVSGLEFIRRSKELCEKGMYVELGAYKYHVFVNWREVQDNTWHQYSHLNAYLNGRGVPSVEEALREVFLQPVRDPFTQLVNAENFKRLMAARVTEPAGAPRVAPLLDEQEQMIAQLLLEIRNLTVGQVAEPKIAQDIRNELEAALLLPIVEYRFPSLQREAEAAPVNSLKMNLGDDIAQWAGTLGWVFVHALGRVASESDYAGQSRTWIDEWLLGKIIAGTLQDLGLDYNVAWRMVALTKILTTHQCWFETGSAYQILENWLGDDDVRMFLQVNRHQGVLWFNRESFDEILGWMFRVAVIALSRDSLRPAEEVAREIISCYGVVRELQHAEAESKYQVERLLQAVKSKGAPPLSTLLSPA